jgi:hypothetical protein
MEFVTKQPVITKRDQNGASYIFVVTYSVSWNRSSEDAVYEEYGRLGCKAMEFGASPTFRRNTVPRNKPAEACSKLSSTRILLLLFSLLVHSFSLMTEVMRSSETSDSLRRGRPYNPEDCTFPVQIVC